MFKKLTALSSCLLSAFVGFAVFAATPLALGDGSDFITRRGSSLFLQGVPYRFAGSNNYYPIYKSQLMVNALFDKAKASNFRTMRVWGALDIGNQDGSNSVGGGPKEGVYFQYWNGAAPAYNDGATGLQHLDYVIYKAHLDGLRLVIPFVNNWNDFGGMDQYVRWRGGNFHDDFYSDSQIRQWYKNWIAHLLNRINTYSGVMYKDDPTIMTWELANEPRCLSAGVYPRSTNCTTQTLVDWASDVSTFVKSIDHHHLVSVGDEGFFCNDPTSTDFTLNCSQGVDTVAFAKLEHIDVMSLHLYPDSWGKTPAWGTTWIRAHMQSAQAVGKAVMLGEFGLLDKNTRNPVYREWIDTVLKNRGNGALYWILSDVQDDGTLYPDYDGYTVYCPSPVCSTFSNFSWEMRIGLALYFAPVADNDSVVTQFNNPVTIVPLANDTAYPPATLAAGSIDLDAARPGQQTSVTVAAGTFAVQSNDSVLFTPAVGYSGPATAQYTARDSFGRRTNVANINVTVLPAPTAPIVLYPFEDGIDGWHDINNNAAAGTLSQIALNATLGSFSLQIVTGSGGDWFGNTFASVNLSAKTHLKIDMTMIGPGQGHAIAIQTTSSFTWCQGPFVNANANSSTTVDVDLIALGCTLNDVRGVWIFLGGSRTYYLDNVRAE